MILFQLKRVAVHEYGAFGVLLKQDIPFAVTLERTFENLRVVVPTGTVVCKSSTYYKGGYPTYELIVEGHSRVLFHKGNKEEHSRGCVLVAESFHDFGDVPGVANSAGGFKEFMKLTEGVPAFRLEVSSV
jgi:hypothetical protein